MLQKVVISDKHNNSDFSNEAEKIISGNSFLDSVDRIIKMFKTLLKMMRIVLQDEKHMGSMYLKMDRAERRWKKQFKILYNVKSSGI